MPRGVWVLFATTLVNRAGTMVLPFLILYMTRELHFTAGRAGFVMGLYGAGALVSSALSGRLSDVLGPMKLIRDSLYVTAAIFFAFPLAKTFPAVVIGLYTRWFHRYALIIGWACERVRVVGRRAAARPAAHPPARRRGCHENLGR